MPLSLHLSCQISIHSPSFHSYEPNIATGLSSNFVSTSSNIGSNSPSSNASFPMAGQPKAKPSKSPKLSALNSFAKKSSPSHPFAFTSSRKVSAIFSVLPVPDQYTTAIFAIIISFLFLYLYFDNDNLYHYLPKKN